MRVDQARIAAHRLTATHLARRLEFEGRPHLHMVAPDWQEVAAAVDSWLDGVLDAPEPVTQQAS